MPPRDPLSSVVSTSWNPQEVRLNAEKQVRRCGGDERIGEGVRVYSMVKNLSPRISATASAKIERDMV